eukprot:3467738-Pyramimonas_sp.AAC.1
MARRMRMRRTAEHRPRDLEEARSDERRRRRRRRRQTTIDGRRCSAASGLEAGGAPCSRSDPRVAAAPS